MESENKVVKVGASSAGQFGIICWSAWVVFLVLKCIGVLPAAFTWFWVWFPFWLPFAVAGVVFLVTFVVMMIYFAIAGRD